MDTEDIMRLFSKSTALIVDDEVNNQSTKIYKIRKIFEDKCISFVTYSDIPPRRVWESFGSLSFLIIDWNLGSSEDVSGVSIGSELIRQRENDILDFVEYVTTHYFMPVFLFTQENLTPIKDRILERDALKKAFKKGQVVIRAKSGLNAENIEKLVVNWCKKNPAAYTLKSIDHALIVARNNLLSTLNSYDEEWPLVVYQTILSDASVGADEEFSEFLFNALNSRVTPVIFNREILSRGIKKRNKTQLIELYGSTKVFEYQEPQPPAPQTGDIYVYSADGSSEGMEFIVNITAGCDLRKQKMLFLKGYPCEIGEKNYDETYGILEKAVSAYIPSFYGHACVEFKFGSYFVEKVKRDYHVLKCGNNKREYKRIGRLAHPYITTLQEKFSHYICRHGSIRHPNDIIRL